MARPHDARSVANVLIAKGKEENRSFDPLQLVKLVYLAHAWMLGLYGRKFVRQNVRAWLYGPVIPDLYRSLKTYGRLPVTEPIKDIPVAKLNEMERSILDQIYDKYGNFSGPQLSQITHEEGTPWDITWLENGRDAIISDDLISEVL